MKKIYPAKLQSGDELRVIAPSRSMSIIGADSREIAKKRFLELGLKVSFGKHIEESDEFRSSSIKSRVSDIHDAFKDKKVKAVFTIIGGFNCNQILDYLDWEIIKNNPKIFCGFSDITALNNAIFQKTGLVNYSGPHYSTFSQKLHFDYTLEYFKKCLMEDAPFEILASENWSDDPWYMDQDKRILIKNEGLRSINNGTAEGTIIGGNLGTLSLLQGTSYFPIVKDAILFVEDDEMDGGMTDVSFDRRLQSLISMPQFKNVRGVVIGRFQNASKMTIDKITKIVKSKRELSKIPVIAGVDFGHTDPKITLPIGGEARLSAKGAKIKLEFTKH